MLAASVIAAYEIFFAVTAFVLGAIVGSFLNVVIYRLPLGLSVNEPKRSFCPSCRAPIAAHHNVPIFGWLWLRGRCAHCQTRISPRYPLIELLTAALFLAVWLGFDWLLALPLWIFVSLLIAATFIDFDHFIIPDEITLGGTVAGVLCGLGFPRLLGETAPALGLLWSVVGAVVGFATLLAVVELGKLAFGKKRIRLEPPEDFTWQSLPVQEQEPARDAELRIGAETDRWSELFLRPKDQFILECDRLVLAGQEHENVTLRCFADRLQLGKQDYPLAGIEQFSGRVREYVFPREAMGFGDVKFIACIGAFLGWQAVFFTVAAASVIGSVVGLAALALGPRGREAKLPFGPYLALGALLWLFAGPALVGGYLRWVRGG